MRHFSREGFGFGALLCKVGVLRLAGYLSAKTVARKLLEYAPERSRS